MCHLHICDKKPRVPRASCRKKGTIMVMKTEQPRPRMIGSKNQVERWPQLVIVPGTKPTHPAQSDIQVTVTLYSCFMLQIGRVNYIIDFFFLEI